jgi:ribosomal protein S12 methylthiotransferase
MESLEVMRENPKVCKYLDLPLQHIANPVLKSMKRNVTREETEALIQKIKEEVPGVVLRTTMLVGFPGETDDDISELIQFIEEQKFERLGVFTYSHEDGTLAAQKYADNLSDEVKQARADEIMEVQQQISASLNLQKTGQVYKVIIDKKEGSYFVGRTEFDSPEVDGEVLITSEKEIKRGDFVTVKITGAEDYDLYGELV